MIQPPRKNDSLERHPLTGFVSIVTLVATPEQYEGLLTLRDEAARESNTPLADLYDHAAATMRHAVGNGLSTCNVIHVSVLHEYLRGGNDPALGEAAWRQFCRPFVA